MLLDLVARAAELERKLSASTAKVKVVVPVGKRIDLASAVMGKLAIEFGKMSPYLVQITHGNVQRKMKVPAYLLLAQAGDDGVPVSVPALNLRAKSSEKTRLRCVSVECSLRPPGELEHLIQLAGGKLEKVVEAGSHCELNTDDLQGGAGDEDVPDEEGAEPEAGEGQAEEELEQLPPPPGKRMPIDLWPFAFAKDYYKCLLSSLGGASGTPAHVVLVTTSAHPAPLLAMHDLGIKGHVLFDRVRRHAIAHGEEIMKKCLLDDFLAKERRKEAAAGQKRVLTTEIETFDAPAPDEQPVKFWEVAVGSSRSAWRTGMDNGLDPEATDTLLSRLLAKEADEYESRVRVSVRRGVCGPGPGQAVRGRPRWRICGPWPQGAARGRHCWRNSRAELGQARRPP